MSHEHIGPSITVKLVLEKFDGDAKPGDIPVEVIEREETITDPHRIEQIMNGVSPWE